jgi:hypothetical protein
MRVQHVSDCRGYSPGSVSDYHEPLTGCVASVRGYLTRVLSGLGHTS